MKSLFETLGWGLADYNEWEIRWATDDQVLILTVLCLLAPVALWFSWTSLSRIRSRSKKALLFGLRALTFFLLLLLLLQPFLELRKVHARKNSIAVLLDNSKSMSIKTFPADKPRIDLVKIALEKNRDYFEKLKEDYNVDYYFVSDRIEPSPASEVSGRYRPRGVNTDFDKVFAELKRHYAEKPLGGVMLFSDGADLTLEGDTLSRELAERLAGLTGPLHTFQVGTNEMFKDLAVENVEIADFGFVYQPFDLTVTVYASAIGNKNVPLVLKEGENILISKILEVREGVERYQVDLQFTPNSLGKRIYTLSLPLFAGESISTNNRRDFQINIIRDRLRVLHLNGRPSWDSRFLREVLVNNPKVDLLSFFILRTLGDDVEASTSELSLIPFPSNLLFKEYLDSFDLVIFQNFRYEPFVDRKYLHNIKTYVDRGGAFLMIGGELSFQGGAYERTAIEELLPVSLHRQNRFFVNDEFPVRIGKRFVDHPVMRLEKDKKANRKIWQDLPRLNGVNVGLEPEPEAHVLMHYDRKGKDAGSVPILVLGRKGKGRTALLATDSSWNWNFRRVGEGGSGRYYQKFWNNLLDWLTRDPSTRLLQLETDKDRYGEGEPVLIKARLLEEDFSPAAGKKVRLTIQYVSGSPQSEVLETDKNGDGAFQFLPEREGYYSVRAEFDRKDEKISEEVHFGVFGETAEFQRPLVNGALLQKMAEITGGDYRVLDENADLGGHRFPHPEVLVKTSSRTLSLWDNWWSYGLILGLLFFDWWSRRRSGLS